MKSCILTFRCLKKDVCQNILNYFTVIDYKVATRNQGCSINLPRVRIETAKKGFYLIGGKLYNELPLDICKYETLQLFTSRFNKLLHTN